MTTRIAAVAADDAARDYASDAEYRAYTDKVAPYRVIAKAVILARSRQDITQQQLAEAIGTTASAISRIESGEHAINLETLNKLGTALGISFVVGSPRGATEDAVGVYFYARYRP